MKKGIVSLIIIVTLMVGTSSVLAFNSELKATVTNIKLFLNGKRVDKDIVIIGESSYLPVKAISEALGLEVSWDGENRAIHLSQKDQLSGDEKLINEFGIFDTINKENKQLKERILRLEEENKLLKQGGKSLNNTDKQPTPTEKDTSKTNNYVSPKISGVVENGKVYLNWQPINDERLQGYKVVISKDNPNPKYPDDGYLHWITDKNKASVVVDNKESYKNGKFKYLTPGEKYFFSITAVYNDKKVPGNVIEMVFPEES